MSLKEKYRIETAESEPHGDVYELEIDYYYYIIDIETNQCIKTFTGLYSAKLGDSGTWENEGYSGVTDLTFSADNQYFMVEYANKKEPEKFVP